MKILKQAGLLFGLCWISLYLEKLLPISLPSSVIALALLLALLLTRVVKVEHVREKSDFLLNNMPFFFIPATVGIIQYKDTILSNGVAFLVICAVSMVVVFAVTGWAVQLTMRIVDGRSRK